MVIDTSAIIAIFLGEPEAGLFATLISDASVRLMAAPTFTECLIVLEAKKGELAVREFELLVHKASIDIVSCNHEHAVLAHLAWREYGKGRHPASLSFGDCFSYALAKYLGEPLLFTGNDFTKTDVLSILNT